MNKFTEMLRELFEKGEKERLDSYGQSITDRTDITRYETIQYGTDKVWNTLDLYRPREKEGEVLPVIINVHGGGWIYGNKEGYRYYCETLAEHGYAVVNMNYRLVPQANFPAPIEDLNKVMEWVFTNAAKYKMNVKHIFAVGDSAGAHTLGAYAAICSNDVYARKFSFEPVRYQPFEAIALNCGVYKSHIDWKRTDFVRILACEYLNLENKEREKISEEEYEQIYRPKIDRFEFMNYITKEYPDTFVMTAEHDFVKMHGIELAKRLTEQNVNVEYRMYKSADQKLSHVFHTDLRLKEAEKCNLEEIYFFRKHS